MKISRIDIIGQNGATGEHYATEQVKALQSQERPDDGLPMLREGDTKCVDPDGSRGRTPTLR